MMKNKKNNKNTSENQLTISSPPKGKGLVIHIVAWCILFIFPFLFTGRDSDKFDWNDYLRFLLILSGVLTVFYVNYLYLIKRFLFTRQRGWFFFSNFLLFTMLTIITHFLMELIPDSLVHPRGPRPKPTWNHFAMIIFFDYLRNSLVATISVAFKMTASWYKVEAQRKELEQSRSDAELQNLKSQLNPHFLFNTLNNIYSLIAISPERAQDAVHELSRLLRYVLYDSSESFLTVGKDMEFISNYVELMRIRLPEHAELKTEIHITAPDTMIAPLLFITLIENAFKHGISNNRPSFIHIKIDGDDKQISCNIDNSYFPKDNQDKSGSGIGLVNLAKRLNLLYPDKYVFNCSHDDKVYSCKLQITF